MPAPKTHWLSDLVNGLVPGAAAIVGIRRARLPNHISVGVIDLIVGISSSVRIGAEALTSPLQGHVNVTAGEALGVAEFVHTPTISPKSRSELSVKQPMYVSWPGRVGGVGASPGWATNITKEPSPPLFP